MFVKIFSDLNALHHYIICTINIADNILYKTRQPKVQLTFVELTSVTQVTQLLIIWRRATFKFDLEGKFKTSCVTKRCNHNLQKNA